MGRPCSTTADDCATPAEDHVTAYLIAQADALRAARQLRDALAAAWLPTTATTAYLNLGGALERLDAVADDIRADR